MHGRHLTASTSARTNDRKGAGNSSPNAIEEIRDAFERERHPYSDLLSRRSYEGRKAKFQAELPEVQIWAQETGQKFVLLFESRDAAGMRGTIMRFLEHLNPRTARVVALSKPTEADASVIKGSQLAASPVQAGSCQRFTPNLQRCPEQGSRGKTPANLANAFKGLSERNFVV